MHLKDKVLHCLIEYPETRNSDILLTQKIWKTFHYSKLKQFDGEYYVKVENLLDLPREDTIKRIRATIQNQEKKYLPTNIEVVKKRKINELAWREYINQQNAFYTNPARG